MNTPPTGILAGAACRESRMSEVATASGEAGGHLDGADLAMHRYADGDDAAFAEVFTALASRLRTFLWRLSGSSDLAEDLMQETLLRIHHARGSFARGRRVAPWAYAIARNCFISHARSAQSKLAGASGDLDKLELAAGPEASGEETSIARQSALVVERALASMTEARREAFILLRYEGMSVAAAAQIVGITEGALKIRAFHAYEIIRAALDAAGRSPGSEPAGAVHGDETKPTRARKSSRARTEPEQA
jgi:RNA polymerase sigma-70 factor, ECF subfamily